jgi:pimeloyl-ACP methyl ester carboxylesterase
MVSVGEARFGYDDVGEGTPMLLVHAGCGDRRMWVHQLDALAGRHRVIAYDWRGYGESDAARAPISRHADLLSVLEAMGEDRAVLTSRPRCGGWPWPWTGI